MPILTGDVKLVASQVMNDVEEGGGAPTSTEIVDGTSNALFNDISELDRAGGRVNLRKVFASIQTDTTDTYLGGNVVIADPPDDPRVAVTIFSTESVFDRRTQARDRIEAYLNKGSMWNGYLLENHIAGQRTLQLFQRESAQLPAIGKTLPGFDITSWNGIFGPAGMPKAIAERINSELQLILKDKAVQEQLAQVGFEVWPTATPDEFALYVKEQLAKWGQLVKQAGIEAQ